MMTKYWPRPPMMYYYPDRRHCRVQPTDCCGRDVLIWWSTVPIVRLNFGIAVKLDADGSYARSWPAEPVVTSVRSHLDRKGRESHQPEVRPAVNGLSVYHVRKHGHSNICCFG